MKTTIAALLIAAAPLTVGTAVAHADYAWVADDSANICNFLSLQSSVPSTDWVTLQISLLQSKHDISRAEAVTGIQQAANGYCPRYTSNAPTH